MLVVSLRQEISIPCATHTCRFASPRAPCSLPVSTPPLVSPGWMASALPASCSPSAAAPVAAHAADADAAATRARIGNVSMFVSAARVGSTTALLVSASDIKIWKQSSRNVPGAPPGRPTNDGAGTLNGSPGSTEYGCSAVPSCRAVDYYCDTIAFHHTDERFKMRPCKFQRRPCKC